MTAGHDAGPVRVLVADRGTALRRTTVLLHPHGGCTWLRRPGPAAGPGLPAPSPDLARSLAAVRTPAGSRLSVAARHAGGVAFAVPSARSLSEELITGRRAADTGLVPLLAELGRLLAGLHRMPSEAGALPPSLHRLAAWLHEAAAADGSRRSVVLRTVARGIGARRTYALAQFLSEALPGASAGARVLVHGWCGLGHVVLDPDGSLVLTIGEDAGWAPAEVDVGLLFGQLHELEHFLPPSDVPWDDVRASLLDGHGRVDPETTRAWAALGVALHVHDFATYFDVRDDELPRWVELLVRLVDGVRA